MFSRRQKEVKGVQWSKYTVMKRRTGSLIDLAKRKGAFPSQEGGLSGGANSRQSMVQRQGRTKSESNLLKKLLNWNHIHAEKNFMDHDGLDVQ